MGTDIHFYVERKVDGAWALYYPTLVQNREDLKYSLEAEENFPESLAKTRAFYDRFPGVWVDTYEEEMRVRGSWEERRDNPLYLGRNYDLFAILADVRNGRGFAGVPTGAGFNPIADDRGVPDDASPGYKWEVERYGSDGHSHSWFTVRELMAYDWDQRTTHCGWVNPVEYQEYKKDGRPSAWCGGIYGSNVRKVSHEEMDQIIALGDIRDSVYTFIEWQVSYRECVSHFVEKTVPALQQLGDPDEVRIVFFFDN